MLPNTSATYIKCVVKSVTNVSLNRVKGRLKMLPNMSATFIKCVVKGVVKHVFESCQR